MIPIFDSLAHPTVQGTWLGREATATPGKLVAALDAAGFVGACAVGLAGQDGYSHEAFRELCRPHRMLTPVAGVTPHPGAALERELDRVRELGFGAIKIHPRTAGITRSLDRLGELFRAAAARDLVVFYCTYFHGPLPAYPHEDPFYALVRGLEQSPEARVVLMHGGDVSLLRYAELVRHNPNLLLDLSLTILKYRGSSVDADLAFLFRQFDRRICIGTDFPEYQPAELRARFDALSAGIPEEKARNIGYANLRQFLAL